MSEQDADLIEVLDKYERKINHVFERCKTLGQLCRDRDWTPVVCHADIHVGNVIKTGEDACAIIDWDDPRLAPRECDLMFFLDGGIADHDPWTEKSFFDGYGSVPVDPILIAYYKYARAAEDIVSFSGDALNEDLNNAAEALKWLKVQFGSRMIVESAWRWEQSRCSFSEETVLEDLHN